MDIEVLCLGFNDGFGLLRGNVVIDLDVVLAYFADSLRCNISLVVYVVQCVGLIVRLDQKMITMLETSASDGNPMTVDQVYDVVMGTRSGYIKGMGNGPKPQTSRSTRANTSHLEEQMKTTMSENFQL
nr:uncharacterized protein LOC109177058 [Ipomoea batatas]